MLSQQVSQLDYLLSQKRSKKKSYGYSVLLMLQMLRLLNNNPSGLIGIRQCHFLPLCITWNRIRTAIDPLVNKGFVNESGIIKRTGRGCKKQSLKELRKHQHKYFFITPKGMLLLSKLEALDKILPFEELQRVYLGTNRRIVNQSS